MRLRRGWDLGRCVGWIAWWKNRVMEGEGDWKRMGERQGTWRSRQEPARRLSYSSYYEAERMYLAVRGFV